MAFASEVALPTGLGALREDGLDLVRDVSCSLGGGERLIRHAVVGAKLRDEGIETSCALRVSPQPVHVELVLVLRLLVGLLGGRLVVALVVATLLLGIGAVVGVVPLLAAVVAGDAARIALLALQPGLGIEATILADRGPGDKLQLVGVVGLPPRIGPRVPLLDPIRLDLLDPGLGVAAMALVGRGAHGALDHGRIVLLVVLAAAAAVLAALVAALVPLGRGHAGRFKRSVDREDGADAVVALRQLLNKSLESLHLPLQLLDQGPDMRNN